MRITNGIINNNTKANVLVNKEYTDKYNTMVATGQKINRPSEDPIVAIRALRLNNNIMEINQFYDKNIPDAESWLRLTETALSQTESVLSSVKEHLTQGASDDNTAEDRLNILENLKALRDQIYSAGNADYAGRTLFTGYRTSEPLTFMEDATEKYTIIQDFNFKELDKMTYISGVKNVDTSDLTQYDVADYNQTSIESKDVYRLRLAYDKLTYPQVDTEGVSLTQSLTVTLADGSSSSYPVKVAQLGTDSSVNDSLYTSIGDNEVTLIADTGELILGKNVAAAMGKDGSSASIEYAKDEWKKNDPRPEHYYACKAYNDKESKTISYNYNDAGNPGFENRKISYEIAYNQKLDVNVNAKEAYDTAIGRDVDELVKITQQCIDSGNKYDALKKMKKDSSLSDDERKKVEALYDAAEKEFSLNKEKMQKMFSQGLTTFGGYTDAINLKIAYVGSLRSRLELTKERVGDQLSSFKELAVDNIHADLTETAIDLTNAETALQAALASAAKVASRTLLDYL